MYSLLRAALSTTGLALLLQVFAAQAAGEHPLDRAYDRASKASPTASTVVAPGAWTALGDGLRDLGERVERGDRKRDDRASASRDQDRARQSCGGSNPCYTEQFRNNASGAITLRCEAGYKKGSSETIWIGKTAGCIKTSATSGNCQTYDQAARFVCSLDR